MPVGAEMQTQPTPEYRALKAAHAAALREFRRVETLKASEAEQVAYDALIDYVETHYLNYTKFDPRMER